MAGRPAATAKAEEKLRDARVELGTILDSIDPDKLQALVVDGIFNDQPKKVWVTVDCKHCSKTGKYEVEVPVPDPVARAKALDIYLSQAKGAPVARVEMQVDQRVLSVRVQADLAELSDAQLAAIVAGDRKELTSGQ